MRTLPALLLLMALAPAPVLAQDRLPRADFSGTLGWFSSHHPELESYNQWANESLIGEIGAGFYWTPHWKTEVLAGASTETDHYGSTSVVINGQPFFSPARFHVLDPAGVDHAAIPVREQPMVPPLPGRRGRRGVGAARPPRRGRSTPTTRSRVGACWSGPNGSTPPTRSCERCRRPPRDSSRTSLPAASSAPTCG